MWQSQKAIPKSSWEILVAWSDQHDPLLGGKPTSKTLSVAQLERGPVFPRFYVYLCVLYMIRYLEKKDKDKPRPKEIK